MVKTAVLLLAYGSPERLIDIPEFLTILRKGVPPSPSTITEVEKRYQAVGGSTSFNKIILKQAKCLHRRLHIIKPGYYEIFVGMRYWKPSIVETLLEIKKQGCNKVIAIVLCPHYSHLITEGYKDSVIQARNTINFPPHLVFKNSWHLQPHYIECLVNLINQNKQYFDSSKKKEIIFTAHSLPKKTQVKSDPYETQLLETCKAVAEKVGETTWHLAYQSASKREEAWLEPDIRDILNACKRNGIQQVLICPVGFVADNLELLYDIDIEAKEYARTLGIDLCRVPSCNTHPLFIEALSTIVTTLSN